MIDGPLEKNIDQTILAFPSGATALLGGAVASLGDGTSRESTAASDAVAAASAASEVLRLGGCGNRFRVFLYFRQTLWTFLQVLERIS